MGEFEGGGAVKIRERCGSLALAVLLLTGGAMGGRFAAAEQGYADLSALPAPTMVTGSGHAQREGQIDINRATAEELDKLPGIGPTRAAAIIAWREEHGPFRYPEDLLQVKGIGETILAGLLDQVTVGGE